MKTETNRRGFTVRIFEGQHLKLTDLKRKALHEGLESNYLYKEIPEYPKPEFHVSFLKHDTTGSGLRGIRKDGGFRDPYGGSLVWWSLTVGPEELKDAEMRLLEKTFPDRMVEDPEQQSFLWRFATSPAFKETSRLGWYRFTFSLEEVLTAYREQFCCGSQPIMRIYQTELYSQEVMHVVLVHSPASEKEFSHYPVLSLDQNAVCGFSDGCFTWRPEAMCETHRYELVYRHQTRQLETWKTCPPQYYVWDHVAVALHVGQKVLKFNADNLRTNLKFCQPDKVFYGQNTKNADGYDGAKAEVKKLWSGWDGLLEKQRSLKQSLTVTDIQLVLVGWPGVGKSSSGNTILGKTAFMTSSAAASQLSGGTKCSLQRGTIFSREVTIIDTPGFTGRSNPDLKKEIFRCINLCSPAPHAVLLVVRLGCFPTNVEETVKQMEGMFGENVWSRTIILFTHQDQLEPDVKTQLQQCRAELKELVYNKVGLYQVLNANPDCRDLQIWDLLHVATKLVSEHI